MRNYLRLQVVDDLIVFAGVLIVETIFEIVLGSFLVGDLPMDVFLRSSLCVLVNFDGFQDGNLCRSSGFELEVVLASLSLIMDLVLLVCMEYLDHLI